MPKENINVIIRFRPTNKNERQEEQTNKKLPKNRPLTHHNDEDQGRGLIDICSRKSRDPMHFAFDRVLGHDVSQEETFRVVAQRVCDDVLDGYNGTIFAYGQTGSGKTYTMIGSEDLEANPSGMGIVPRSVSYIFSEIEEDPEIMEARIKVSFVEIYKEKLRDLLNPSSTNLKIRMQANNETWISNVTETHVLTLLDVLQLMEVANSYRTKAQTAMNLSSSRSHMLMSLTVALRIDDGSVRMGKIHFADLAGSEKVRKTGATGQRLKEAQKINLSLTLLGQVISALCDSRRKHVPYRDSKLTHILKDSLGGNCKTTLIVNCSPHISNRTETIGSLRFGSRCKLIQNEVKVNRIYSNSELMNMVMKLKKQNTKLKLMVGDDDGDGAQDSDLLGGANALLGQKQNKKMEKELKQLRVQIAAQTDDIQHLNAKNESLNNLSTHLKQENIELEERRHDTAETLEKSNEQIGALQSDILQYKLKQSKLEDSINHIIDENQRLMLENKALNQLNEEFRIELTQTRVDRHHKTSKLSSQLNKFKEESSGLMETVVDQRQKLEEFEEALAEQTLQLEQKAKDIKNVNMRLSQKEQEINGALKKFNTLQQELFDAQLKIQQLEAHTAQLNVEMKRLSISKEDAIESMRQTMEQRTQDLTAKNFELSKKCEQREIVQRAFSIRSTNSLLFSTERDANANTNTANNMYLAQSQSGGGGGGGGGGGHSNVPAFEVKVDSNTSTRSAYSNKSSTSRSSTKANPAMMHAFLHQQQQQTQRNRNTNATSNTTNIAMGNRNNNHNLDFLLTPQESGEEVLLRSASLNSVSDVIKAEQKLITKHDYLKQMEIARKTERDISWAHDYEVMPANPTSPPNPTPTPTPKLNQSTNPNPSPSPSPSAAATNARASNTKSSVNANATNVPTTTATKTTVSPAAAKPAPRPSMNGYQIMSARTRKKQQRLQTAQNLSYLESEKNRLQRELAMEERELHTLVATELPADTDQRLQCLLDRAEVKDRVYKLNNQLTLLIQYTSKNRMQNSTTNHRNTNQNNAYNNAGRMNAGANTGVHGNNNNDANNSGSAADDSENAVAEYTNEIQKMTTFDAFVEHMDAALAFKGSNSGT